MLHLDDEEYTGLSLKRELEPVVRYKHVERLSEVTRFVDDPDVCHFVLDLRLHDEPAIAFTGWGNYPHSTAGLIAKLRHKRPDVSLTILTNYPNDPEIRQLVNAGLLTDSEVIAKMTADPAQDILARITMQRGL